MKIKKCVWIVLGLFLTISLVVIADIPSGSHHLGNSLHQTGIKVDAYPSDRVYQGHRISSDSFINGEMVHADTIDIDVTEDGEIPWIAGEDTVETDSWICEVTYLIHANQKEGTINGEVVKMHKVTGAVIRFPLNGPNVGPGGNKGGNKDK